MVKKIYSVFDFYIKSSLHISFCVLALIIVSCIRLNIEINFLILFIVFNATVIVYNFIKYASTLPYYFFVKKMSIKKIQYLSFFCGFSLIISLFYANILTIFFGLFLSLFCFIYVIPFNRSKKNIRNHSRIKIFIVAFCWASVTVLFPLTNETDIDFLNSFIHFIQRFVFVIAYTIPFEIRDLKYDSLNLKTMPQVFGIKKTKKIALFLLSLFTLITLWLSPIILNYLISDLLIALIAGYLIWISRKNQTKYFASFWVESIPLIWLIIILLLKSIN